MLEIERLEHILAYLRQKQTVTVKALAKQLYVSEATARRDLTELERQGLVKRLHGGAVLLDSDTRELPLYVREQQNAEAKRISWKGRPLYSRWTGDFFRRFLHSHVLN